MKVHPLTTGHVRVQRRSIDTILAHAREHPTVFLPSHDPDSVARLAAGTLIAAS